MLDILEIIGGWSLLNLWLPVLVWTVVAWPICLWLNWSGRPGDAAPPNIRGRLSFPPSFCIPRRRELHPLAQQAARQALLLALPLSIAGSLMLSMLPETSAGRALPTLLVLPSVLVSSSAEATGAWAINVHHLLGLCTVCAVLFATYRLTILAISAIALRRLRRSLAATSIIEANAVMAIVARAGLSRRVDVACVPDPVMPMTFGFTRPLIVLPESLLADGERLRMTLAHELIHIRRGDYLAQWTEHVVAALFAVHPLAHMLRQSIIEWRERACDAAVLGEPRIRPAGYAALLRDTSAQLTPARQAIPSPAVAFATNPHHLKTRINAMKNYTKHLHSSFSPLRVGLLLGFSLFVIAAVLVACTEVVDVTGEQSGPPAKPVPSSHQSSMSSHYPDTPPPPPISMNGIDGPVYKVVQEMPQLLPSPPEALRELKSCVKYPALAKTAGIEGMVFVGFVVDEQGDVANASVVRGIGAGADAEALRCVNEVIKFSPGMQNGSAVNVQMAMPVRFVLNGSPVASPLP